MWRKREERGRGRGATDTNDTLIVGTIKREVYSIIKRNTKKRENWTTCQRFHSNFAH